MPGAWSPRREGWNPGKGGADASGMGLRSLPNYRSGNRQAAGGARSDEEPEAKARRGGPRPSRKRVNRSGRSGATSGRALSTWARANTEAIASCDAIEKSLPEASTTKVHPQSALHGPAWPEDRGADVARGADTPHAPGNSPAGDSQQQTHGVAPQFLPSHCHAARAWVATV